MLTTGPAVIEFAGGEFLELMMSSLFSAVFWRKEQGKKIVGEEAEYDYYIPYG